MTGPFRRAFLRALVAALVLPCVPRASAAPFVLLGAPSPEESMAIGMPLSAKQAFLSLSPGEMKTFPLLPGLLQQLAEAGFAQDALSLFNTVAPLLGEPVRSEAHLAAGKILFGQGRHREAERLFRNVSGTSASAPEASLFLARILAAEGDGPGALLALAAAPPGAKTRLVAGELEMARGNPAGALAAWRGAEDGSYAGFVARILSLSRDPDRAAAVRALRAAAGSARPGTPEHSYSTAALVRTLLEAGERRAALEAAREGISGEALWKSVVSSLPGWDGTSGGGNEAWRSVVSLYPHEEDAGGLFAAGGRFLARVSLEDALGSAENGIRRIALRVRAADNAVALLREDMARRIRRAEEIHAHYLLDRRRAGGMRDRLKDAADSVVLSGWGKTVDPKGSALLETAGNRLDAFRERVTLLGTVFRAKTVNEWSPPLSPEDRVMVLYAQIRLSRLEDSLRALEGSAALLRGRLWNRWKAEYARRTTRLLDSAQHAGEIAATGSGRANHMLATLKEAQARQELWSAYLRNMDALLARQAQVLAKRRSETRGAAMEAFREAVGRLRAAVERRQRTTRYLAARAATEWLIEGKGSPADNAALPAERRTELLREAAAHWEAAIPPAGEPGGITAEALYALAEIRLEEADIRFFEQGESRGAGKEYSASMALFRRVLGEYPDSPYAEPALYGLAVAYQETGALDDSVATMETLLARYPRTRFANEISLRLGESAFDRYEFRDAERHYRRVGDDAPADLLVTARFKLGWSLYLQERAGEAVESFLSALLLSPAARRTGGVYEESARMTARSLVDAGRDSEAETFLSERGAASHGPAVLLEIQAVHDAQNRYADAATIADRMASAYPLAAELVSAEIAAADALRKGNRVPESYRRKEGFHRIFGPGSRWQASTGRTAGDIARANMVSEEGLRTAAFFFHAATRNASSPPADRQAVLASYDAYLSLFPTSPKTEEVAYQRAWLLFEAGRKKEALPAFETVAASNAGGRGEAARYMALQSAKDISSKTDPDSQSEVVRLAWEYERTYPKGERIAQALLDRATAHFNLREFADAAGTAHRAALLLPDGPDRRKAQRLEGDARFEASDYAGSESTFREILAAGSPEPEERRELEKWVAFSLFRRAEGIPASRAAEAAALFLQVAGEFPSLEIAPTALFRSGTASLEAGKTADAIAAFLQVEAIGEKTPLSADSTRRLARLYETTGNRPAAAERYERLGRAESSGPEKGKLLLRAAELFSGIDESRSRRNFLEVASLPDTPPELQASSLFRAAESARKHGTPEEADRLYGETIRAHRRSPGTTGEIAGKALFQRAEFRFAKYLTLSIVPPLEKTFGEKQAALEASANLYVEAVGIGDAETVSASLHRLGEGMEDFRAAILSSPPPRGLSAEEREEYVFLLEEKAAPIEEKAVDAYGKNLRQAVAADFFSPWVEKSLQRLKALRPARFARKGEFAFPVVTVPEFVGVIERRTP